jgi:endonuclease-3 related protein
MLHCRLLEAYGPQGWWPANTEFELLVGAILVQGSRWTNVERAIARLRESDLLEPDALLQQPGALLRECIRPAGFQTVKSRRLKTAAAWYVSQRKALENMETAALRAVLLGVAGIGPETADVLLLYLFRRPVPVADGYTRRILARLGLLPASHAKHYEPARRQMEWMGNLAWSIVSELHALLIEHAKRHCRETPDCQDCTLAAACPHLLAGSRATWSGSPGSFR